MDWIIGVVIVLIIVAAVVLRRSKHSKSSCRPRKGTKIR